MHGLALGDLNIEVQEADGKLVQRWKGSSNSRDPSVGLRPFLELAVAEASTRKLVLELHFEDLGHFNSSTVATLLRFIEKCGQKAVKLVLYYNGSQRWQGHNFEAISLLNRSSGLVEVHRVDSGDAPERMS
ncbi:MAG: hypothetical protein IPJ65_33780 [Archangiaceae bacterium]|nr:hypothetical protein [Archangiaceae bacterium]